MFLSVSDVTLHCSLKSTVCATLDSAVNAARHAPKSKHNWTVAVPTGGSASQACTCGLTGIVQMRRHCLASQCMKRQIQVADVLMSCARCTGSRQLQTVALGFSYSTPSVQLQSCGISRVTGIAYPSAYKHQHQRRQQVDWPCHLPIGCELLQQRQKMVASTLPEAEG